MPVRTGRGILERLEAGVVLGAEGYVFELERRGYIKAGPYVPEVVLDFPDAVRELHREFLRAGADVMVALTYYAHREKLKTVGRENDLEALNRQPYGSRMRSRARAMRWWLAISAIPGPTIRKTRRPPPGWSARCTRSSCPGPWTRALIS